MQVASDALAVGGNEQPVTFGPDVGQLEGQDGVGGERADGVIGVGAKVGRLLAQEH